jgi:serine/alanine adding enzyme
MDYTLHHIDVDDVNETIAWDVYVDHHVHASFYHHSKYLTMIRRAFGHKNISVYAKDTTGKIVGVLPLIHTKSFLFGQYITSLPFFNYGGVLADNESAEQALIDSAIRYAQSNGVVSIQLREMHGRFKEQPQFDCSEEKMSMVLKLPEEMKQIGEGNAKKRAKLRSQAKLAVRKAEDQAVVVRQVFGHSELLGDFYHVFSCHMRDLGTPVYGRSFFATVLEHLGDEAILTVSYWDNKPVACGFLIRQGERMEIPWASTLKEANGVSMNTYMYWNILEHAMSLGVVEFDFGRSSVDAGTYKFKKQWGAEPQQCYWYTWTADGEQAPDLSPKNSNFDLAIKVWQRLPLWVTKLAGPQIVKNLP